MLKMTSTRSILLTSVLALLVMVGAPAFASEAPSVVGSWEVAAGSGDGSTSLSLFTFHRDGTVVAAPPSNSFSAGHGAWERTGGAGQFASSFVSYVYGPTGDVSLRVRNRNTIEVSQGGDSLVVAFEATVETLDGTVLQTIVTTGNGTRISASD